MVDIIKSTNYEHLTTSSIEIPFEPVIKPVLVVVIVVMMMMMMILLKIIW